MKVYKERRVYPPRNERNGAGRRVRFLRRAFRDLEATETVTRFARGDGLEV